MAGEETNPWQQLGEWFRGMRLANLAYAFVSLGLPDAISEDGLTVEGLAEAGEVPLPTMRRLVDGFIVAGLIEQNDTDRLTLTKLGTVLRRDTGDAGPDWVQMLVGVHLRPWRHLAHSARTGENAFWTEFGQSYFEHLAQDADAGTRFARGMARHTQRLLPHILRCIDWSGCRRVADLGGGTGTLLRGLLDAHPHLTGIVVDRPEVIEQIKADTTDRLEVCPGDFFADISVNADTYILKLILHDWPDEQAAEILARCARACDPGDRLIIIEMLKPDDGTVSEAVTLLDLAMLLETGGRERTREEYCVLLEAAGFVLKDCIHLDGEDHALLASRQA